MSVSPFRYNTMLKDIRDRKNIQDMYNAVEELICAFVINQEEVARAKKNKKSMLKVYQGRDTDLEYAFEACLQECQEILQRYR